MRTRFPDYCEIEPKCRYSPARLPMTREKDGRPIADVVIVPRLERSR